MILSRLRTIIVLIKAETLIASLPEKVVPIKLCHKTFCLHNLIRIDVFIRTQHSSEKTAVKLYLADTLDKLRELIDRGKTFSHFPVVCDVLSKVHSVEVEVSA